MKSWPQKIESTLSGMKFAIIILIIMTFLMVVGTFLESLSDAGVANVLIYKSPIFILVEALLFLSVALSMIKRFPFKKRLIGFYLLHTGILLILLGSFVTFHSGLDGQMRLVPNQESASVQLPARVVYFQKNGMIVESYDLADSFLPQSLDYLFDKFVIKKYYPYGQLGLEWRRAPGVHSLEYLENSQRIILSTGANSPQFAPVQNSHGRLLLLIEDHFEECFLNAKSDEYLVVDYHKHSCQTLKQLGIKMSLSKLGNTFFEWAEMKFFPDMTPYPMDDHHSFLAASKVYAISVKHILEGRVQVFSSKGALKIGDKSQATGEKFQIWRNRNPEIVPAFSFPVKDERGELLSSSYVVLEFDNHDYLLSPDQPLQLGDYQIFLGQKIYRLSFQLKLDRFKMEMNPGTDMPASFESFVKLVDDERGMDHHIYMNHPLKHRQFLFYQSSYFETAQGYGTVLSVNYDPGRGMKYLGSLILVLGALIHYFRRSKGSVC